MDKKEKEERKKKINNNNNNNDNTVNLLAVDYSNIFCQKTTKSHIQTFCFSPTRAINTLHV